MFFYLTTHSTHFIYGYMASDIWLRTILIVRKETRCRHIGYSYRLTARVLLYAPSHRQDNTYHGLCYTSRGALAGTRNISHIKPQWTIAMAFIDRDLKYYNLHAQSHVSRFFILQMRHLLRFGHHLKTVRFCFVDKVQCCKKVHYFDALMIH